MSNSDDGPSTRFSEYLSPGALQELLRRGSCRRYRRNEPMLYQGDHGLHVLVLVEGGAKVVRTDPQGAVVILAVRRPIDLVGEAAVLDDQPRSAAVHAAEDTFVRIIAARDFRDFLERFGAFDAVLRFALGRLREADDLRTELASLPVRTRVIRTLLRLAASSVGPVVLSVRQDELAQSVGASRNAVVQELAYLRRLGVIVTRRTQIRIDNLAMLRSLAE